MRFSGKVFAWGLMGALLLGAVNAIAQTASPSSPLPPSNLLAPIPMPPGLAIPAPPANNSATTPPPLAMPALPTPGGSDGIANSAPAPAAQATNTVPPPPPLLLPAATGAPADTSSTLTATDTPQGATDNDKDATSLAARLRASPNGIVLPPPPKKLRLFSSPKDRPKTWSRPLKPVITSRNIAFNYKNQILPAPLSMPSYNQDNQHLPIALYREDYDRLLLEAVITNDLNGTRALLDAGSNPNLVTAQGETLMMLATRAGANDTVRLLMARGAR